LLRAEILKARLKNSDPLLAALGGESSLLEGLEVARDRALGASDLGGDRSATFIKGGLLTNRLLLRGGEGVADERAVAVDAR
jgi:hypothetical protein